MKKYDKLQYVFACMFTRSSLVKYAIQRAGDISDQFYLTSHENNMLKKFIQTNGDKILVSAMLSEEKRWREFFPAMKYTANRVSEKDLKKYWGKYLISVNFKGPIPESPALDAIQFLEFLENQNHFGSTCKAAIEYDITINKMLLFQFKTDIKYYNYNSIARHAKQYSVQVNPSFIVKKFDSELNGINQDGLFHGFYKDFRSGLVKSMQMNQVTREIIKDITTKSGQSLFEIINMVNAKVNNEKNCINFITQLINGGIIVVFDVAGQQSCLKN